MLCAHFNQHSRTGTLRSEYSTLRMVKPFLQKNNNTQQQSFWFTKSMWSQNILHVHKLNPDVLHKSITTVMHCWYLYKYALCEFRYLYSLYFFLYGFLKLQPGAVSTACAPFVATSKTAVIANCPDFKQMHNIRTTIKLGPSSQSHRDQEWARRHRCCRWAGWPESKRS